MKNKLFQAIAGVVATGLIVSGSAGAAHAATAKPQVNAEAGLMAPQKLGAIGTAVKDQYIVEVKAGHGIQDVLDQVGVRPRFVYDKVLHGFSATLTPLQLKLLKTLPGVLDVSPNHVGGGVWDLKTQNVTNTWQLDRVDQRTGRNGGYTYEYNGSDWVNGKFKQVDVYVIDSGIDTAHPDFGGRAVIDLDVVPDKTPYGKDCNGHGTMVAGIAGSTTYGVAKGVKLHSVRVLGCDNKGTEDGMIAGINSVAKYHGPESVANLSFSLGRTSDKLDTAVNNLVNSGVTVVVAAANDNKNACTVSPARASRAIVVGATDWNDRRASFSNYGQCVHLFAPGVGIVTTTMGGGKTTGAGGTSMSAPMVAGALAMHISRTHNPYDPNMRASLLNRSTWNVVQDPGCTADGWQFCSKNALLFTGGL